VSGNGIANLIPVTKRTKEEARAISAKGGRTKSVNKCIAAKLREMKQKANMSDNDLQFFIQAMQDPGANILRMQKMLEEAMDDGEIQKRDGLVIMHQLHRLRFGNRTPGEESLSGSSININFHFNLEEEKQ
jgi:hypothetical protein